MTYVHLRLLQMHFFAIEGFRNFALHEGQRAGRALRGACQHSQLAGRFSSGVRHACRRALGDRRRATAAALTAVENLKFFASLYKRKSRDPLELLTLVGLQNAAQKKVETFSKGMRMRLNFVRAIQHDPEILFLDEPTAGLDPVNARTIKRIIADLRGAGKTIVLTTHNMNDVDQLCDRVSFMVAGRFAALDAPEVLKAKFGRRTVRITHGRDRVETDEFALDDLADNARFQAILRTGAVRTLHSQEASLDQVFSDVTGASLDLAEEAT
jgi:fluoroquinolone transport system ATP-binding protein